MALISLSHVLLLGVIAHLCVTQRQLPLFSFGRFDKLGNTSHIVSLFKQTSKIIDHELPTSLCIGMCENKTGEGGGRGDRGRGKRRRGGGRGGRGKKMKRRGRRGRRRRRKRFNTSLRFIASFLFFPDWKYS